ncbi:MAG: hypothetical protein ACKVOQ_01525 [Cyclobacteriaceae bacterium]
MNKLVVVALFVSQFALGQSAKVLVQNAMLNSPSKAIINVKWYSQSFVYPKGVNVYRRAQGESIWTKLNDAPLVIQPAVPPALAKQDEELKAFHSIAKDLSKSKDNGFVLLSLFGKSFQSEDFSTLIGIQFNDEKLVWGSDYEYRVTKLENAKEIELGVSKTIQAGTYQWDKPVEDFTAKRDKEVIKMNWKPDENRFYAVNIYRSSSKDTVTKKLTKKPIVLSEAKGNPPASDAMFQDKDLQEGVSYYYRIGGLDFFGAECALSEKVEVKIADITPPASPLDVKASVQSMNVQVSWNGRTSPDLNGYAVYRSIKSDGPFSRINPSTLNKSDSTYTDVVPQAGYYYYYVAAIDLSGNEGASERAFIEVKDIVPPSTPQNVDAKPDTGKIVLSWSRNKELDLMGYYVYRSIKKQKESKFLLVNAQPLKDTTYTQVFAKNASNLFSFKVVAVDTSYNNSLPSVIVSAKMPDAMPPLKPIIKTILIKNDTAVVRWAANPDADLAGYNLFRFTEKSPTKIKVSEQAIALAAQSYHDIVKEGGKFYYELQALDSSGNTSLHSDPYPVDVAEKFSYNFKDVTAKFQKRKGTTLVTWAGPASAQYLRGFVVFRKAEPESIWKPLTGLLDATTYEDKALAAKTKYHYQVRAYSSLGEIVQSEEVSLRSGEIK